MTSTADRVGRAREQASLDAKAPFYRGGSRAKPARRRFLAVGDPQAPLETLLRVLDGHGTLSDDGRLRAEVHLVSMGDHFDWGGRSEREGAARSSLETLAWLAAHPPDQVTLLVGNHDLARVGELVGFSDRDFSLAQSAADRIYAMGAYDPSGDAVFRRRYPNLPGAEAAARDFSTFRAAQRDWVASLLRHRRFCAALAPAESVLLSHAGVTRQDLEAIGLEPARQWNAPAVAEALNARLDEAVLAWDGLAPLHVPPIHQAGSAGGEARGIFCHRPSDGRTGDPRLFEGPPRRRFDPRDLPSGLVQAIGHIRDGKCRELMRSWALPEAKGDTGSLRHLVVRDEGVVYQRGLPPKASGARATLLFLDGGMGKVEPGSYELLDVGRMAVASRGEAPLEAAP